MLRFVLFLSFALGLYQTATAGVVRVADGDCAGFEKATAQVADHPTTTTILLARNGSYVARGAAGGGGCNIALQYGSLTIEGNGATITAQGCAWGSANVVAAGASLTVRNLRIVDDTDPGCMGTVPGPLFSSGGNLSFENVVVFGANFTNVTLQGAMGANTVLRNTTWIGASLAGTFDAYNSTFINSSLTVGPSSVGLYSYIYLSNSLVSSTKQICPQGGTLYSRGGNVLTDSSCGLSASTGDRVVSTLDLPAPADHGGLVPTVQIGYGNPGYRFGVAQYCEATDARGVTRNATNCDAGAYESGGGLGLVTENGMNGLYYVPGIANGHYVSVQRIHDNKDVMVFWNTFDRNGNQAWLFGVGTLTSDRHVHALMYRNLGGVLQPGGAPTGAKPSEWGTVDIDVATCAAAQFNYQSSLPEFGSGQFPLTRLAFESAINCGD